MSTLVWMGNAELTIRSKARLSHTRISLDSVCAQSEAPESLLDVEIPSQVNKCAVSVSKQRNNGD
jgi:hypothetical protein